MTFYMTETQSRYLSAKPPTALAYFPQAIVQFPPRNVKGITLSEVYPPNSNAISEIVQSLLAV